MDIKYGCEEIYENIYWVGSYDKLNGLHCNPYLIIDGDEAILIDPGSVIDFEIVYKNVTSLIDIEKLKYIVLSHQDPDICSSTPLFEKKGVNAKIITHWRTGTIADHYGIKSKKYIVNENRYEITLKSGRKLKFIPTPYLHFPGAIVTYDAESKILFSSDLFGAISTKWSLYADESYMEVMKTFHEHYMPGNQILRPVMEVFLKMDISMIASQHGSIIKENVKNYIMELRDLQCGVLLNPIKKELMKSGGYTFLCNKILDRLKATFKEKDILKCFEGTDIELNKDTLNITNFYCTELELWENFFEIIYTIKGARWITVIQPMVTNLIIEYETVMPEIFRSKMMESENLLIELRDKNKKLTDRISQLNKNIKETSDSIMKCPITNFYNEEFFAGYLSKELNILVQEKFKSKRALLYIDIDNINKINNIYGNAIGDETIKNLAYILNSMKEETHLIFKRKAPGFAYFITGISKSEAIELAETIRNKVEKSEIFIESITVSIGLISFDEIYDGFEENKEKLLKEIMKATQYRLIAAKRLGMNMVVGNSDFKNYKETIGKILIVDKDYTNMDVLKTAFKYENFHVLTAENGYEALKVIEKESPDLIISEIMLPKMEGFILREKMIEDSKEKSIPFIVMSHQKNEDSVIRAMALEVDYYFQKPFLLSEMIGVVKKIIKGVTVNGNND
ncbi:response regulator [Clostridium grantii]|uniref:Stage 0 sporulation protein A homolog n=1 Tax=Clostridium grantii DSM 8605 TaxID=1121316 RepID=A0A1M5QK53_9CLOT|nr:response regulator [Clostridium grantii]SHH14221.1 diguanylate cyclase (GGDEF) domain-containing protein [Clostridium grantii DSM 8605]